MRKQKMKMKKVKTQTYEIGFSYDYEEDGETCEYTTETLTDLTTDYVKELDKDKTGEEWKQLLSYLVNEEGIPDIPHEEISNLTWEYTNKAVAS